MTSNARICFLCKKGIVTCRNYKKVDRDIEEKLIRLNIPFPAAGLGSGLPAPVYAGTRDTPASTTNYICRPCLNKLNAAHQFQAHSKKQPQTPPPKIVLQPGSPAIRFKRLSKDSPTTTSSPSQNQFCQSCQSRQRTQTQTRKKTFRQGSPLARALPNPAGPNDGRKKKLDFTESCKEAKDLNVKLMIQSSDGDTGVPNNLQGVCDAIGKGDLHGAIQELQKIPEAAKAMHRGTVNSIVQECTELCRDGWDSNFKATQKERLKKWSYQEQERELEDKAPTFLSCLKAAAIRPVIASGAARPSARKTYKTLRPGIMGAAGSLLYLRNERMNAQQLMTALTVKRGGCGDKAISRLQARGLSVSYSTALRHQVAFGSNYNGKVHQWRECLEQDMKKEKELANDPVALNSHNKSRHPGYLLNGDNVDLRLTPRQMTRSEGSKDLHYFQAIAVKNRIADYSLSSEAPARDIKAEPLSTFLPSVEDNKNLREDWIHLVTHIIGKHIPPLRWMSSVVPQRISHPYMAETKKKTEVVNLGVLTENENTNEGMVAILSHMNQYVPVNEDSSPIPILSGGDLLTCERECNAKMDREDSDAPMARWSGLIPVIDDFHTMANFLSVIWALLYSPSSARDTGTLYAARNFLRAHDVTKDPMKNINAAVEFVDKYTDALVVTAALEHFGMDTTSSNQTINQYDPMTMDPFVYIKEQVGNLIDKYIMHDGPKLSEAAGLVCPHCGKSYKRLNGLRAHMKQKHKSSSDAEQPEPQVRQEDGIYNYSCASLSICLLLKDFQDARRHGDGQRVIRLYKFLLLYFKLAHRTKYSFQTFRLLAQVNCTLSPRLAHALIWNRFVNHSGKEDGNIEIDRENEFHNRVFKEECRQLHGKVTEKSVKRVSQSAQEIDEVLRKCDKESFVRSKKGDHTNKDTSEDVVKLALAMKKENIFHETPNRHHCAYPSFPKNLLRQLDLPALHGWMVEQISKLS